MSEPTPTLASYGLLPRQRGPLGVPGSRRPMTLLERMVPPARNRTLFGLPVAAVTLAELVDIATASVETRSRLVIGVLNAAKVVKLRHDAVLRDSLLTCDLLVADGQSVVWASRFLGRPLPERVAGIDVFEALLGSAHREGRRVYLLGGQQEVLDDLLDVIALRWPDLEVAGSHHGYFEPGEEAEIAADVAASRADMLFVAMTTPKKEIFLGNYGALMGVPLVHGVGGSFDVVAGHVRRAPAAWQHLGLEWAYRLLQEPRRLWRRYLVTNSAFLGLLVRERLHRRAPYARPTSMPGGVRHG